MRKASLDHTWERAETYYLVPSLAMPSVTLKVWRTDGVNCAPDQYDLRIIANLKFPLSETVHLRNCHKTPYATFDVSAVMMPTIPEMPKDVVLSLELKKDAEPA